MTWHEYVDINLHNQWLQETILDRDTWQTWGFKYTD